MSQCSSQLAACSANPDCVALSTCLAGCADQACLQACGTMYPMGLAAATPLLQCAAASCGTVCQ
jgi:hypothetical protein